MPITTGVVPPQRVLDEAEDVCEYLYAEGMASLQRCVLGRGVLVGVHLDVYVCIPYVHKCKDED